VDLDSTPHYANLKEDLNPSTFNLKNDLRAAISNSNLGMISYVQKGNHIRPNNPGMRRIFYFGPLN
jgi:hypothetical protein